MGKSKAYRKRGGVHVFRLPPGYLDIFHVAAITAHAVGRTVDGRLGVGDIKGRNGHRVDQLGGKGGRLERGLASLGVAMGPGRDFRGTAADQKTATSPRPLTTHCSQPPEAQSAEPSGREAADTQR
jgi:hypothetical protein